MPNVSDAVDQATRLNQIGFPEFTSKLINDTFDALVASMIRQEKSYIDLVEKVAMTIDEFAEHAVPTSAVHSWLVQNCPANEGSGTCVTKNGTLTEVAHNNLENISNVPSENSTSIPDKGTQLSEDQVNSIRKYVSYHLAEPRMQALEELVTKGVVRVVVDDGTIKTDLDFHTKASEHSKSTSEHKNKNTTEAGFNAGFVGELFGISGGAKTHNVNVSTRTSQQSAEAEAGVNIQGHVEINIRGDYEPLSVPQQDSSDDDDNDNNNNNNNNNDNNDNDN